MKDENKRPVGRPRVESYLTPAWKEIMIEAGKNGQHVTHFLIELGISWQTHYNLLNRSKEYKEAFDEYQKFCEQWWYDKAHEAVRNGESNKFNQRLWGIVVSNKFRDTWREKQVDITTQGEKLNQNEKIQIEIIKKNIDGEE